MPPVGMTEITALLVAVSGLLTVILVQARGARAEARHRDAETQQILAQIAHDTRSANAQVSNTHDTNLREDLDSVGLGVANLSDKLTEVAQQQRVMSYQQQRVSAEMARQAEQLAGLASDVREVRASTTTLAQNSHNTHAEIFGRIRTLEQENK